MTNETARLKRLWHDHASPHADAEDVDLQDVLSKAELGNLDLFDAMQLRAVIGVCRQSKTLSDARRKLFAASRGAKARPNDADRLKKYLARFGLSWDALTAH